LLYLDVRKYVLFIVLLEPPPHVFGGTGAQTLSLHVTAFHKREEVAIIATIIVLQPGLLPLFFLLLLKTYQATVGVNSSLALSRRTLAMHYFFCCVIPFGEAILE
jgi:hypothetical protein